MDSRPSGDALDQSIYRLLDTINQRREQVTHLAHLVERTIYVPDEPEPEDDLEDACQSIIEDPAVDDRPSSTSPPASLFEGFTRDFVDGYEASVDGIVGSSRESALGRMILDTRRKGAFSPTCSDRCMSPEADPSYHYRDTSAAMAVATPWAPDPELPQVEAESEAATDEEARGPTVIDRDARTRLWQRVDAAKALRHRSEDADEDSRIHELVQLAERIAVLRPSTQPEAVETPLPQPRAPAVEDEVEEDASAQRIQKPRQEPPPARKVAAVPRWGQGEWERWAEQSQRFPSATAGIGGDEMAARLEWVHEQQQAFAWQHGFSDAMLPNGKLKRTYRDLPLDLQAYPDGNVKRTATAVESPDGSGQCSSTTLFFANGDWSCTIITTGRHGGSSTATFYFYSAERVWHEQHGRETVYRYADGREEHTAADGTLTVRHMHG